MFLSSLACTRIRLFHDVHHGVPFVQQVASRPIELSPPSFYTLKGRPDSIRTCLLESGHGFNQIQAELEDRIQLPCGFLHLFDGIASAAPSAETVLVQAQDRGARCVSSRAETRRLPEQLLSDPRSRVSGRVSNSGDSDISSRLRGHTGAGIRRGPLSWVPVQAHRPWSMTESKFSLTCRRRPDTTERQSAPLQHHPQCIGSIEEHMQHKA
ncbi:MAG: hypothetical protein ACI841_003107 [Planctomycetota bacterium]